MADDIYRSPLWGGGGGGVLIYFLTKFDMLLSYLYKHLRAL